MTRSLTPDLISILDGTGRPSPLGNVKGLLFGSLINEIIGRLDAIDGSSEDHAIAVNTIAEYTAASGVTVDGLLIKDGAIDGASAVKTNVIAEHTSATGVTIDGLLIKDSGIDASGLLTGVGYLNLADNLAAAWTVKEGSTSYLVFVTTDSGEAIRSKVRLTTSDGVASGTDRVVGGVAAVNPAASTAITGTTETQANFDTGTYSIPANTLKVGTIVRVRAWGRYTATTGSENHVFGIAYGATNLCVTGNIDPATNDVFEIEFEFEVRAVGASGTVTGVGVCRSGPQATAAPATHFLATGSGATSTTTIDTTATTTLGVFVDRQATATDSDSMRLDGFRVEIIG
jgi:hypothetical protein